MKLLYVTDNGFSMKDGQYVCDAPNQAHMGHLKKYFSLFVVVARNCPPEKSYRPISDEFECETHLVAKNDIIGLNRVLKQCIADVDAVMCYSTNGYFASRMGKKYKKIVVAYSGGDPYDFLKSRHTLKGDLLAPIGRYTHKRMFENAQFGHYCDDFLMERYPASGEMMACSGVSIEYSEENLRKRLQKIRFKEDRKFRVGLIGHTKNNLKGIDIAIKTIGLLGEDYSLEVVGRGEHEEYDALAKECGCFDRVKFLGTKKPGEEIFGWLDSLDIYIQPSRIEGLPRATIEAMSRGCPIVASNAGAISKLLEKECIILDENIEKYAKKIKELSDKPMMERYAIRNFKACKVYSTEERDRKYDEFYGKVAEACQKNYF